MAKTSWLTPVAMQVFVGTYDPAKLRFLDKAIAALPASPLHGVGPHDERDWAAISAWADGLPAALGIAVGAVAAQPGSGTDTSTDKPSTSDT